MTIKEPTPTRAQELIAVVLKSATDALALYNEQTEPGSVKHQEADNFPLQALTALKHHYRQTPHSSHEIMESLDHLLDLMGEQQEDVQTIEARETRRSDNSRPVIGPDDKVLIYTDGSCLGNPGNGGYAALVLVNDAPLEDIVGHEPDTTNNRMELRAVLAGLQFINGQVRPEHEVMVVSDSKYCVDAFNQGWIKNWQKNGWRTAGRKPVANQDLWHEIVQLTEEMPFITFAWVKGHSNNQWNNHVDAMAVQQAELL